MNKIVIVDYGAGNLNSVKRIFTKIGCDIIISNDIQEITSANKLVLSGVGNFKKAMQNMNDTGIINVLNEMVLKQKIPILGICLGMQLMAKHSEEGDCDGLGWFDTEVVRFKVQDKIKYKIPHIGWNNINITKQSKLIKEQLLNNFYYFVHSYHIDRNLSSDVLAICKYEYEFPAALEKDNIYGVQFHPEKSYDVGEQLLLNFIKI